MSNLARRTVTLTKSQSDYIDAKIAQGEFVSASEVVRAGLAALAAREANIERWLNEEVMPAYEASIADPDSVKSGAETLEEIRAYAVSKATRVAA